MQAPVEIQENRMLRAVTINRRPFGCPRAGYIQDKIRRVTGIEKAAVSRAVVSGLHCIPNRPVLQAAQCGAGRPVYLAMTRMTVFSIGAVRQEGIRLLSSDQRGQAGSEFSLISCKWE